MSVVCIRTQDRLVMNPARYHSATTPQCQRRLQISRVKNISSVFRFKLHGVLPSPTLWWASCLCVSPTSRCKRVTWACNNLSNQHSVLQNRWLNITGPIFYNNKYRMSMRKLVNMNSRIFNHSATYIIIYLKLIPFVWRLFKFWQ